jgi:RNA polymerase sigma factor (sigma-70 family)
VSEVASALCEIDREQDFVAIAVPVDDVASDFDEIAGEVDGVVVSAGDLALDVDGVVVSVDDVDPEGNDVAILVDGVALEMDDVDVEVNDVDLDVNDVDLEVDDVATWVDGVVVSVDDVDPEGNDVVVLVDDVALEVGGVDLEIVDVAVSVDGVAVEVDDVAAPMDDVAGHLDATLCRVDLARGARDAMGGKRNVLSCVLLSMSRRTIRCRGLEEADVTRQSGVWAKADAPPIPLNEAQREALGRLYRAEEVGILRHVERCGLPTQVAVEIRADTFLVFAVWARDPDSHDDAPAMLHGIARYLVKNHRRALQRARARDGGDEIDALPRSERDPEQILRAVEDAAEVEALLEELPEAMAALIRRVHLEGETPQEVAEALGESDETIRGRLFRARAKLREMARRRAASSPRGRPPRKPLPIE